MEKEEYKQIKKLCDEYGYANVMLVASALWRRDFRNNYFNIDGVKYPVQMQDIKEESRLDLLIQLKLCDAMIDKFESNR